MAYTQDKVLYLNAGNAFTQQKTDYTCTEDYARSKGYAKSYNVFDSHKKLIKELNLHVHVPQKIKDSYDRTYILHDAAHGDYLIGDYKAGQPYNGFFKQPGGMLDWMIYSYYQNGQLTEQLFNNQYESVTAREDTEEAWTTLNAKNIFKNGILTDGISITPVNMKDAGGSAEIVHTVKNGKTAYYTIGLFAVNYGEFIKVTPEAAGYLLQSSQSTHQIRITFTANGRKAEMLNAEDKADHVIDYTHYPLEDIARVDHKRSFVYIKKGNELYIEQVKDNAQLIAEGNRAEQSGNSAYMNKMAYNLYTLRPLDTAFFRMILTDKGSGMPDYFGQYIYYEGKPYGMVYRKGTQPGTYSVDMYENGKLSTNPKTQIRNKTLEQIAAGFKPRH